MKIAPLGRTNPRPVALLTAGQRELFVETVYGTTLCRGRAQVERGLEKLRPFTCYVGSSIEQLKHTTGATSWELSTWNGRETRMRHVPSGVTVTSLRGTLEESDDAFRDLSVALEWLDSFRVAPASISGMAWALLRASLHDEVVVRTDPELCAEAFFGPRQQIFRPGTFYGVKAVDVVAAYPTAQAARPYALSLRRVAPSTVLDPDVAGLARAFVHVPPDIAHAPLPVRLGPEVIQFQHGALNGVWPWIELAYAKELGCSVDVVESFAPRRSCHLFAEWWTMGRSGRDLPGAASTLAKAVLNATWAQFAMRADDAAVVRWDDERGDRPVIVALEARALPHRFGLAIAAETTARVRVQTLAAIYGTETIALHIDTDGYLAYDDAVLPRDTGTNPGQWRVKAEMAEVQIRAPQFYRWRGFEQSVGPIWHYVASGMTQGQAAETYRRGHKVATRVAYLAQPDAVLAPGHSGAGHDRESMLAELRRLR